MADVVEMSHRLSTSVLKTTQIYFTTLSTIFVNFTDAKSRLATVLTFGQSKDITQLIEITKKKKVTKTVFMMIYVQLSKLQNFSTRTGKYHSFALSFIHLRGSLQLIWTISLSIEQKTMFKTFYMPLILLGVRPVLYFWKAIEWFFAWNAWNVKCYFDT